MKVATIVFMLFAALPVIHKSSFPPPPAPYPVNRQIFQGPLVANTGTFVYKLSIMVKSTIPASDVIECTGNASTFEPSGRSFQESAGVAATRAAGSASCTVMIPYSWTLTNASTDMVSLSYSIAVPVTGMTALPNRLSSQTITSIHVPAPGTTTTETISATI